MFSLEFVKPLFQVTETERAVVLLPSHVYKNKSRGNILRDDAGKRNAVFRHTAYYNEEQIENNIQNARNHKICKRSLRITVCAEYAVAEVENAESRHSERIDTEIEHGALYKVVLCAEQFQHKTCGKEAKSHDNDARRKTYHKRCAD